MAVWLSALRAGRNLHHRKIPGTPYCYRLSGPQGHSGAGRIQSIEKIHLIGTRTRELPACSVVPQPTTLPRAPEMNSHKSCYDVANDITMHRTFQYNGM
jgi:hypothetical protein